MVNEHEWTWLLGMAAALIFLLSFRAVYVREVYLSTRQKILRRFKPAELIPSFIDSLQMFNLQELIEEEEFTKAQLGFSSLVGHKVNIHKCRQTLEDKRQMAQASPNSFRDGMLQGEVSYQSQKVISQWIRLNCQSQDEELVIKSLLSMPMVPKDLVKSFRLQSVDESPPLN
mmetsp:Transcript_18170/g.31075  ORF Transcript_18170/g.31075 Transcript_18170/m.31075 type:complete len:172 (-) Transcript_18170:20-535(-)